MIGDPVYDPPDEECPNCGGVIESEILDRVGQRIAAARYYCAGGESEGCGYERTWRPGRWA